MRRKQQIDAEAQAERAAREKERAARSTVGKQKRKGEYRGDGDAEPVQFQLTEMNRMLEDYHEQGKKNTQFFVIDNADEILKAIGALASVKGYKISVSDTKYKAKLQILSENSSIEIQVRVMKMPDTDGDLCIQITRVNGDALQFQKEYTEIKNFILQPEEPKEEESKEEEAK